MRVWFEAAIWLDQRADWVLGIRGRNGTRRYGPYVNSGHAEQVRELLRRRWSRRAHDRGGTLERYHRTRSTIDAEMWVITLPGSRHYGGLSMTDLPNDASRLRDVYPLAPDPSRAW